MPEIIDDKSEHAIPFILKCLKEHQGKHGGQERAPPFFLGLNGVQGAGKTTLVIDRFFFLPTTRLHNTIKRNIQSANHLH